jgi:hypothetical protein
MMPTMFKRTLLARDAFLPDDEVRHLAALTAASGVNRSTDLTQIKPPPPQREDTPSTAPHERAGGCNRSALPPEGSSMRQHPDLFMQHTGALGGAVIRGA